MEAFAVLTRKQGDPSLSRSLVRSIGPRVHKARWETLVENAQADDLKLRLDDALESLEKAYPDKLRGLLPRIYAGSIRDRDALAQLINVFKQERPGSRFATDLNAERGSRQQLHGCASVK